MEAFTTTSSSNRNRRIQQYINRFLLKNDFALSRLRYRGKHFFQNIKQLLTSSTHYLNLHFDNYDYACSHNFLVHIKFPRISEIPEFNVVLSWLKLFDVGAFPFVNITSSSSMLFSYSAHSKALFSQLLNSQHLRNVKFLRIQNDFYCWHHYPYPFPLKLSSIAKWLFISEGPKIIRFFNEDNPGKLDCICPIETFLIPMLISLLETTNWKNYSYLIIHPTCVYCFNFIYVVQHSKLSHYLRHILVYTNDYLALWLHTGVEYTTEKFELIWYDDYLYIRRSSLYGPLQKELDPQYCTNYFKTELSQKRSISANIKVNFPRVSNHSIKLN